MSKILVSGGAGFIGSSLVDKLIQENNQVVIIDDLSSGREDYLNPLAKFYKLDIASPIVKEIFKKEKFDFVYHLAAQIEVSKSMLDPLEDNRINVLGAWNILENCRINKVKKIIFSSSGGAIYGQAEEIPTPESAPTYPLSFYGIHKLTFEKYLNSYYHAYGLDYTILRFANVYGPRQFKGGEAGVIAIFIDQALKGLESKQYGDGRQTRDFVYVTDVVQALYLAKDTNYPGEINISCGKEINLLDVRLGIEKALGKKMKIKELKPKIGEQRRSCLNNQQAQEILKWQPKIDLEQGIEKTIKWSKKQISI